MACKNKNKNIRPVTFCRNQIKGDNARLRFSISNSKAESWLLTTYLDPELRISRETTAACSCSSRKVAPSSLPDQTHTHSKFLLCVMYLFKDRGMQFSIVNYMNTSITGLYV